MKKDSVPDVPADDPVGTMERFNDGLRRVLLATKAQPTKSRPQRRQTKRR